MRTPAVRCRSLTVTGTPHSAGNSSPRMTAASASRAWRRARSSAARDDGRQWPIQPIYLRKRGVHGLDRRNAPRADCRGQFLGTQKSKGRRSWGRRSRRADTCEPGEGIRRARRHFRHRTLSFASGQSASYHGDARRGCQTNDACVDHAATFNAHLPDRVSSSLLRATPRGLEKESSHDP